MGKNSNKPNEKIKIAHKIFLECGGDINMAIENEKMPYKRKSTLLKIAKDNKWYDDIKTNKINYICQKEEKNDRELNNNREIEQKEDINIMLKELRKKLFDEIINDKTSSKKDCQSLKIIPKTLSEAVKALIDIDKRISEKEISNMPNLPDAYKFILEKCAKKTKDEENK